MESNNDIQGQPPSVSNPQTQTKFSKAAIASFILGLLSPVTLFVTLLPAVVFGVVAIAKIHHHPLRGSRLTKFGLIFPILSFVAVVAFWAWDMPPIENDYTMADLRSAPPECEKSYAILLELLQNTTKEVPYEETPEEKEKREKSDKETLEYFQTLPGDVNIDGLDEKGLESLFSESIPPKTQTRYVCIGLGLDGEDDVILEIISDKMDDVTKVDEEIKFAVEHQTDIERLWQKAKKGRVLLQQLDSFAEIANLTEPTSMDSFLQTDVSLINLKVLWEILYLDCLLECERSNCDQAARELILFDSVISKTKLNSRYLLHSLAYMECISRDLEIASTIATHPNCKPATLETLKKHFGQKHSISFENELIFEYLLQKATVEELSRQSGTSNSLFLLKKNSTLRVFRNYTDGHLKWYGYRGFSKDDLCNVCRFMNVKGFDYGQLSTPWRLYSIYNPTGSRTILILTPAIGKIKKTVERINRKTVLLNSLLDGSLEDSTEHNLIIYEPQSRLYADYVQSEHEITCRCWECDNGQPWLTVCEAWITKHKDTIGVAEVQEKDG